MTMIKIKDRGMVDVSSKKCANRPCLHVHEDKGTFTPGVGYTSYYKNPRLVCMTRHQYGCPQNSVCAKCRTVSVNESGSPCEWYSCDGLTVDLTPRNEVQPVAGCRYKQPPGKPCVELCSVCADLLDEVQP